MSWNIGGMQPLVHGQGELPDVPPLQRRQRRAPCRVHLNSGRFWLGFSCVSHSLRIKLVSHMKYNVFSSGVETPFESAIQNTTFRDLLLMRPTSEQKSTIVNLPNFNIPGTVVMNCAGNQIGR